LLVAHVLGLATRRAKIQVGGVGGMHMKKMLRLMMFVVVCAGMGCAQEGIVNVNSEGKQKWSPSEVNRVYLSACTAVEKDFGNRVLLRPNIVLVLGADKNAVDFDKKTILLKSWDRGMFAEGVVVLAFEGILTPERRIMITTRAVNLAQATVNVREITK
jgi:hypothetical protein